MEQVKHTTPKANKTLEGELVKTKMGRPSKLTPEIVQKAYDWLTYCGNVSHGTLLPTIEGLAIELDITRETLYDWETKNNDFSDIIKKLRQYQAEKLIQNALSGRYNPMIAKLMLSKHGYVEKTEQDQNINIVQPILGSVTKKLVQPDQD